MKDFQVNTIIFCFSFFLFLNFDKKVADKKSANTFESYIWAMLEILVVKKWVFV